MSITVRSKREINNRIIEANIGIKMSQDILSIVEALKHRKQVNKLFTDALDKLGYHAYICKDKYSSKLVIRKRVEDENHTGGLYTYVEISIYNSHLMTKQPFTWQQIIDEVKRYDYAGRLVTAQEQLACVDDEVASFSRFVSYVESQDFKCFDLWRIKSDLKEALLNAKRTKGEGY